MVGGMCPFSDNEIIIIDDVFVLLIQFNVLVVEVTDDFIDVYGWYWHSF